MKILTAIGKQKPLAAVIEQRKELKGIEQRKERNFLANKFSHAQKNLNLRWDSNPRPLAVMVKYSTN